MTPGDLYNYEILISNYNDRFGKGAAEEIFVDLILPFGFSGALSIFKKAKDREIIPEVDPEVIDGVIIRYKRQKKITLLVS